MTLKRLIWILIVAILIAGMVRLFLLDSFRVASGAMSESLFSGDRVMVEKWTLGARIPQAVANPFSTSRTINLKLASTVHRIPGLSQLRRNDLIVFNQPQKSDSMPINLRPILLSRCVGLPGEVVQVEGQHLFVNGMLQKRGVDVLYCFYYQTSARSSVQIFDPKRAYYTNNDTCFTFLTKHEYSRLTTKFISFRTLVRPYMSHFDTLKTIVPYKGMTLKLDSISFQTWHELINAHENCLLAASKNGGYKLNGISITRYTFKQDYFLLLNDHQGYLNDSRTFGLVPTSHIIGRSLFVLYSPAEKRFLELTRH